ncbi:hypothetical protein GCM10009623_30690 [Nocardioides aestuarii]
MVRLPGTSGGGMSSPADFRTPAMVLVPLRPEPATTTTLAVLVAGLPGVVMGCLPSSLRGRVAPATHTLD